MDKISNTSSSTPRLLDIKHGSAALTDTKENKEFLVATGASSSAMATTTVGVLQQLVPEDDSLVLSPISDGEKKKANRSRSPTPRPSSSTRRPLSSSSLKRPLKSTSLPRGRRPAPRPPSPATPLQLAANEVYINNDGDIGERVERLERQRMVDQHSLAQMAASIQTLERHFASAHDRLVDVEEAMRGPERDLKIRKEIWDLKIHL